MTIKERAIEKHCTCCGARTEYNCSPDKTPCSYVKDYIKIATEQRVIDIDKAWKFIESIVEYTGLDSYDLEEEYKKAMEE